MYLLGNCPFKFECLNFEDLILEHKEDHGIFGFLEPQSWEPEVDNISFQSFVTYHICSLI